MRIGRYTALAILLLITISSLPGTAAPVEEPIAYARPGNAAGKPYISGLPAQIMENELYKPELVDPMSAAKALEALNNAYSGLQSPTKPPETIFGPNKPVTVDQSAPFENEPSITANPKDPRNLVVAAHHYMGFGFMASVMVGAYVSFDGGETWEGPVFMELANETTDYVESDPALAAGPSGTFYLAYMSVGNRFVNVSGVVIPLYFSSSIMVARSSNGTSWSSTEVAGPTAEELGQYMMQGISVFTYFLDKEYIAAGPSVDGSNDTVVVAFMKNVEGYNFMTGRYFSNLSIVAVVSNDGGRTWSNQTTISNVYNYAETGEVVQGAMPAVAPNGTIFIAYYYSGDDGFLQGKAEIRLVRSDDGGRTWSKPRTIAVFREIPYFSPGFFRWSASMFPVMDIGPDGTIYIVYVADPPGKDPADVYLIYSKDWGNTWKGPIRVNDDPTEEGQFFPWISVSPDGVAHIIWGDMRRAIAGIGYDVYYARFTPEEGVSKNYIVTDYPSPTVYSFIGDYFNLVATEENVHVVWTDTRSFIKREGPLLFIFADQTVYTAKLGERPEPSVSITPSKLPVNGRSIVEVEAENMPVNAVYVALVEDANLALAPFFLFSDSEGRISEVIVVEPYSRGEYGVVISDYLAIAGYAGDKLTFVDEPLEAVNTGVGEVLGNLQGLGEKIDSGILSIKGVLEGVRVNITLLGGKVDTMTALISDGLNSIEGRIAKISERTMTIETSIGRLEVLLDNRTSMLNERVIKLEDLIGNNVIPSIKLVQTSTGELKAVIDAGFTRIEGKVVELGDGIATIRTGIGDIKVNLDNVKTSIQDSISEVSKKVDEAYNKASEAGAKASKAETYSLITLILVAITMILTIINLARKR
ncbi:MAG: glycoside hydrolase [Desulfurococcales archaeon]|nr:glycoside hydrolase [Desulfurococcales archaeon]